MMPDSADSTGYGTRICSVPQFVGGVLAVFAVTTKSQMPLRFCQSGRVSCGRGYSGNGGVFTGTCEVHGVASRGVLGTQTACAGLLTTAVAAMAMVVSALSVRTLVSQGRAWG
jgi:hypothetical protein